MARVNDFHWTDGALVNRNRVLLTIEVGVLEEGRAVVCLLGGLTEG